jgi:hypothetical protein
MLRLSENSSTGACAVKTGNRSQPKIVSSFPKRILDCLLLPPFSHKAVSFCLPAEFRAGTFFASRHNMTSGKSENEKLPENLDLWSSV